MMLFCNLLLCVPSLQNVCTPEVRGSAFAIFSLTDDIGKGLGPGKIPVASQFALHCGAYSSNMYAVQRWWSS
jgi:hypothetical protein